MALTETQFKALQEQLRAKKSKIGETEYSTFIDTARNGAKIKQETTESSAFFPSSPSDSPLEAGLKSVGNVPSSSLELGKNLFSAVASPIETGKGLFRAVTGLGGQIQNLFSTGVEKVTGVQNFGRFDNPEAQQTFDAIKSSLNERYGSLEAAQKTATEDPVGFGADVIGILSGTKILGKISEINDVAKSSIAAKLSTKFDDVALGQMQKAINLNPSDIRKIKQPNIAGKDPAEWLLERGIQGSQEAIVSKLDDLRIASKSQVDAGLGAIDTSVPSSQATAGLESLRVLKNDFNGVPGMEPVVQSIDDYLNKTEFTLTDLNEIKRLVDSQTDIYKSTGVLKDSAKAKGLSNLRSDLKKLIEDKAAENGFDAVRDLNKETQVAREISDAMKKRLDVESKLPTLGLRDAILATGGFATGGPIGALGIVVSKKVLESPQFRTYLANKLVTSSPEQITALNNAIQTNRYIEVIQYLAPVINEFEKAQGTSTESEQ